MELSPSQLRVELSPSQLRTERRLALGLARPEVFNRYLRKARQKYKERGALAIPAKHPGDLLKMQIDARKLNNTLAALRMGVAVNEVTQFIKGKRPVTYSLAMGLHKLTGITPGFWANSQAGYEAAKGTRSVRHNRCAL